MLSYKMDFSFVHVSQVLSNPVTYREQAGKRGVGVGVVVSGKPKAGYIIHGHRNRAVLSSVKQRVYVSGQDGRWQQFSTTCSLISVPQWHHTPLSGPS